jgi:hypothetical protein
VRTSWVVATMCGASVLLLSTWSVERPGCFQRLVADEHLALVRGSDGDTPSQDVLSCGDENSGVGQVSSIKCQAANVVCIFCSGDTVLGATTGDNANGQGYYNVGYDSCHGRKIPGICQPDGVGGFTCQLLPWDGESMCSGEIDQAVFQDGGPGGPGGGGN